MYEGLSSDEEDELMNAVADFLCPDNRENTEHECKIGFMSITTVVEEED